MASYIPIIDEDKNITFPAIKQDNTDGYIHNVTQALNELNETKLVNQPWKVLLIGSNSEEDMDLKRTPLDNHYSHELIKNIDNTQVYVPEYAPNRSTFQYGSTSLHYLTEKNLSLDEIFMKNIQFSIALSGYIPGEEDLDVGDVEYGVGELDEYKKPNNIPFKGVSYSMYYHEYVDEEPHSIINPQFIYRRPNRYYFKGDWLWSGPKAYPNYFIFEVSEPGTSNSDRILKYDDIDNTLDEYKKPKNYALLGIVNMLDKHLKDTKPHSNINPYFFLRKAKKVYNPKDTVWINDKPVPNNLELKTMDGGTSSSIKRLEI